MYRPEEICAERNNVWQREGSMEFVRQTWVWMCALNKRKKCMVAFTCIVSWFNPCTSRNFQCIDDDYVSFSLTYAECHNLIKFHLHDGCPGHLHAWWCVICVATCYQKQLVYSCLVSITHLPTSPYCTDLLPCLYKSQAKLNKNKQLETPFPPHHSSVTQLQRQLLIPP